MKYIVKEDKMITEFLGGLFKAIAKRKSSSVLRKISMDPILKRHIKDADEIGKRILKHIEKQKKEDPELAKWMADNPL
ncbi:MAG TPA: hypothetical protein EYG07_05595 [Alphaproteobacteria bacterium]|jgi:signal transduction protein with GAF and PtsI domain|nr:hypothetical protein [Alphaproteobacteria bacterium]